MSSSPTLGSALTAQSLLEISEISISLYLSPIQALFLSQNKQINMKIKLGAPGWLSQLSIQLLISARVMISEFMESSPALGSVLTAWSLLGILSPPLSAHPLLVLSLSLKNK